MELIEAKICAVVSLLLGTTLVGLLPAWFSSYGRNSWPLFTSSLLCFGGGVLLSTSLVHMLPEIRENLSSDFRDYAETVLCVGFFCLYLIDEIVHFFFGGAHSHTHQRKNYGAVETEPLVQHNGRQPAYNPLYHNHREECETSIFQERPSSQLCHIGHAEPCKSKPSVGCFGLLVALSVHAVLEGLAVGLEMSTSKVLLLLGAIASHKLVVGFCLGIELSSMDGNSPPRHLISILIFSMGTPLGVGLGMSISTVPESLVQILLPVLQCLAGGTLLYVSVSEVLPRERARWHQQSGHKFAGVFQFVAVLTGFTIMTVLSKYMEH